MKGVWVAYYSDMSDFAIFDDELEAYKHAVEHTMKVKFVQFGESANDWR